MMWHDTRGRPYLLFWSRDGGQAGEAVVSAVGVDRNGRRLEEGTFGNENKARERVLCIFYFVFFGYPGWQG